MVEPAYASSPYGRAPPDLNSRACFRIQFTYGGLWSSASGPYGRAPKGDGGLISRACLRILISRAPCRVLALGSASPSGTFLFDSQELIQ